MKKTFNINLAGRGFVIDEDAYNMLDSYLSTLGEICNKAGEPELAGDIEARIAEIFEERLGAWGAAILSLRDVEEVIERMGRPEEILSVEEPGVGAPKPDVEPRDHAEEEKASEPRGKQDVFRNIFNYPVRKRLYRDVDNRVFGGVCSGLGWYLGLDPVWIRIIWVVLTLLTGSTLGWIYLILWICVPAAKTPYQRMQMMGVDPSVSNVGKVVTGEYTGNSASKAMSGVAKGFLLVFLIIALFIVGSLLLAFGGAFLGCVTALCISPIGCFPFPETIHIRLVLGCVAGGTLIVGIPTFLLLRAIIGALRGRPFNSISTPQWILIIILWLIGVAASITCGCLLGTY